MQESLVNWGITQRSVFYDELSNMNPVYAVPSGGEALWPLEVERRYHLRNLRLLSLYFDHIVIMTGNLLNFTNHTTRAIVLEVTADRLFSAFCQSGVIIFCGWGTRISGDMLQNQVDYSRTYRPELKEADTINRLRQTISSGELLVREESSGEEDFIDTFLKKLRMRSERSPQPEDWRRIEGLSCLVHDRAGYLGTLEFFPQLEDLNPALRKQVHETYFDAWIDYASERYYPIATYEIPRLRLNVFRATPRRGDPAQALASILLSPEYFQAFLLRFVTKDEYYRLINLPCNRLIQLRNEDWEIFREHYHTYLEACSKILWRIQILEGFKTFEGIDSVFETIIAETIRDLPASIDVTYFTNFLSDVIGYCGIVPGVSAFAKSVLKPLADFLNRRAKGVVRRFRSPSFYPFIAKIRTAVA
jgi:hypothetical protein